VFIDESGVNLAMEPWYARSLRGERARGKKPRRRGKNVSLVSALSLEKVVALTQVFGSVDGTTL
jgi:hypothetical protein